MTIDGKRAIVLHYKSEETSGGSNGQAVYLLVSKIGGTPFYSLKWEYWYWGMGHPDGGEATIPLDRKLIGPDLTRWLLTTDRIPQFIRKNMDTELIDYRLENELL